MSFSFDNFGIDGDDISASPAGGSGIIRPFDDGYLGYDPRFPSKRFDAFSTFSLSRDADPSFLCTFYEKRKLNCETSKVQNRAKEKLYLANQEKFHANADKQYWKAAIAELIPHEIANIEKSWKKEKDTKPSIIVIQVPKSGKPTDFSRLRQILVKLERNLPPDMKSSTPLVSVEAKDAKDATSAFSCRERAIFTCE